MALGVDRTQLGGSCFKSPRGCSWMVARLESSRLGGLTVQEGSLTWLTRAMDWGALMWIHHPGWASRSVAGGWQEGVSQDQVFQKSFVEATQLLMTWSPKSQNILLLHSIGQKSHQSQPRFIGSKSGLHLLM